MFFTLEDCTLATVLGGAQLLSMDVRGSATATLNLTTGIFTWRRGNTGNEPEQSFAIGLRGDNLYFANSATGTIARVLLWKSAFAIGG
jgi:hypothetical protein